MKLSKSPTRFLLALVWAEVRAVALQPLVAHSRLAVIKIIPEHQLIPELVESLVQRPVLHHPLRIRELL